MAHIVADVNKLCSIDWYYRFADKIVLCGRGFWHFLSLAGAKIAAAILCSTDKCPTYECPKSELDNTETQFQKELLPIPARGEATEKGCMS
jgi:hypothetical protein